jgi:DNA-binding HxlR family transcriptional regulator
MSNPAEQDAVRRRSPVPRAQCPMALAAELIGDRWTLLILREAFYGVSRYDDMLADLGAPRSMLTDRLNRLVERGILRREAYREPGSRTRQAYRLTGAGQALALTLIALTQWGEEHVTGKEAPIEIVDRRNGRTLRVALVADEAAAVPLGAATLRLRDPGG